MIMKKRFAIAVVCVLLCGCFAGAALAETEIDLLNAVPAIGEGPSSFIILQHPMETSCVALDEAKPNAQNGDALKIGVDISGKHMASLLRYELPAGITSDMIISAHLNLYPLDGSLNTLYALPVSHSWTTNVGGWNAVLPLPDLAQTGAPSKLNDEGWASINVMGPVQAWLNGDIANNGLIVYSTQTGVSGEYASPFGDDMSVYPMLEIEYEVRQGVSSVAYGAYDFEQLDTGSAVSYALRDGDPITLKDIVGDTDVIEYAKENGESAASILVKDMLIDYIEINKDDLCIASIREIAGLGEEINTATEYVMAVRLGYYNLDGDNPSCDIYAMMRIANGAWAEKTGGGARLVPGTNAYMDVGAFPWHRGSMYGLEQWNDYFDSETFYFAVKKTDAFLTYHNTEGEG
ncbi:hypothetical protein FACS18948_2540 [Clostridia bacterium]|nr:hypothetical protein FACS18948_2540 [Clostridia bacterium]